MKSLDASYESITDAVIAEPEQYASAGLRGLIFASGRSIKEDIPVLLGGLRMIHHDTVVLMRAQFANRVSRDGFAVMEITDLVQENVAASGIASGLVVVQSMHTTLSLVVNEYESGLRDDLCAMFGRLIPHSIDSYRHNDLTVRTEKLDPDHPECLDGHSHCRAFLMPQSLTLIVKEGKALLGRWQSIMAVELDGPRERRVIELMIMGE